MSELLDRSAALQRCCSLASSLTTRGRRLAGVWPTALYNTVRDLRIAGADQTLHQEHRLAWRSLALAFRAPATRQRADPRPAPRAFQAVWIHELIIRIPSVHGFCSMLNTADLVCQIRTPRLVCVYEHEHKKRDMLRMSARVAYLDKLSSSIERRNAPEQHQRFRILSHSPLPLLVTTFRRSIHWSSPCPPHLPPIWPTAGRGGTSILATRTTCIIDGCQPLRSYIMLLCMSYIPSPQ